MNKGLKLLFCKECNRKRFCNRIPLPNYNSRWTCSKGHTWTITGVTLERIGAAVNEILKKDILKKLFERDDLFFKEVMK